MKVENGKMVSVNYTLTVDGQIADQSREGQPLQFICGAGMLLPKFEGAILDKVAGDKVSFTLEPKDGYGEIIPEAVVDLPKDIFMVDGKLAEEIFPANVYGGLNAMKNLSAPFVGLKFLPTGGVNTANIKEYVDAPFIHAVGGSWVCPKADIAAGNWEKITQLCLDARKAAKGE